MIYTRSHTIKKEIRSLGIDLCGRNKIGVVLRGSDFIDGVMVLPLNPQAKSRSVAYSITQTRFFNELRLIMLHDPSATLDSKTVERITGLPVIRIGSMREKGSKNYRPYIAGKHAIFVESTLPTALIDEVLKTTMVNRPVPEPLRIAHAIATASIFREKQRFSS